MGNYEKPPEETSIGGNIADVFGTLESLRTGEQYQGSMNPNGNPYEGLGPSEIIDLFLSVSGEKKDTGIILKQRFEELKVTAPEWFEGDSCYNIALSYLSEVLEER